MADDTKKVIIKKGEDASASTKPIKAWGRSSSGKLVEVKPK